MRKHWQTAVMAATLLAVPLSGCSGDAQPTGGAAAGKDDNGKTTVTVSVLKKDAFLQQAERLFEEANPGIDIDIRAYLATPADSGNKIVMRGPGGETTNEADLEKFRTGVNAELMSGKGADLIALESLPYAKYVDKKLLANLDEWLKGSGFPASEYYTGVLDALQIDGKTYALPVHFKAGITLGNTPLLEQAGVHVDDAKWDWQDMLAAGQTAAQAAGGATAIWTGKPKIELITDMVKSQYGRYVSGKQASFANQEFIGLLEQIGGMYDQGLIVEQADMSSAGQDVFKTLNLQLPMQLLFMPQMTYGGKGSVYRTPSDGGAGGGMAFSSDLLLGMNAKSPNQAEAWKFLQFLLSEDVQSAPGMMGFSVHKASLEKQLRQAVEQLSSGKLKLQGPNGATPSAAIDEQQFQEIVSLLERVDNYAAGDPDVMKIVKEEAAAFFAKGKTAKAAADMIQNRVTTYLNE